MNVNGLWSGQRGFNQHHYYCHGYARMNKWITRYACMNIAWLAESLSFDWSLHAKRGLKSSYRIYNTCNDIPHMQWPFLLNSPRHQIKHIFLSCLQKQPDQYKTPSIQRGKVRSSNTNTWLSIWAWGAVTQLSEASTFPGELVEKWMLARKVKMVNWGNFNVLLSWATFTPTKTRRATPFEAARRTYLTHLSTVLLPPCHCC